MSSGTALWTSMVDYHDVEYESAVKLEQMVPTGSIGDGALSITCLARDTLAGKLVLDVARGRGSKGQLQGFCALWTV